MMEPKPLSKSHRREIEKELARGLDADYVEPDIRALLAAEAYWREAVKHNNPQREAITFRGGSPGVVHLCGFCGGRWGFEHRADCAWKLAQE